MLSVSAGGEFIPTSSCIIAEDRGVHCRARSIECHQEVTADCLENDVDSLSAVGSHHTGWRHG